MIYSITNTEKTNNKG